MKIYLNGEPYNLASELAAPVSIEVLLHTLDIQHKRIAIEVNQQIIPRGLHPNTYLNEGDNVEVIHAIAGG